MMETTISASGLDTFSNVDLALQNDGSFVVSWEGQHRGPLTQTISGQTFTTSNAILSVGAYVQRFDASGQPLAPPDLLASEAGQSFDLTERGVSAAASSSGTLVAYLSASSSTASPQQIMVKASDELFTTGQDKVNFNALTPEQTLAVRSLSSVSALYNALAGDDVITLPDDVNARNIAQVAGVPGVPVSFALNDKSFVFHGGAGADTFDFTKSKGLNGYTGGETLYIDGDTPAMGAIASAPYLNPTLDDTLILPGSPSDYTFKVKYDPGKTLVKTYTTVSQVTPNLPVSINTANIARVTFTNTSVPKPVSLDLNNLYAEMARLCGEVYGPLLTNTHGNEPLASGGGPDEDTKNVPDIEASTIQVGNRAIGRGWHEVSAMELALPPGSLDLQSVNGLRWSFSNGFYQAIGPTAVPGLFATTEANALVLSGVVNDKKSLAVIFRGTDEVNDYGDYLDFRTNHYAKFAPLVEALKVYLANNSNGVSQLLIGGHSLGGGIAQLFAKDVGSTVPNTKLFTFGSPGAEDLAKVPQVNFFQTGDLVANQLSKATQPNTILGAVAHVAAYAATVSAITTAIEVGNPGLALVGLQAARLVSMLQPKYRSGTDVPLGSDIFTATPFSAGILNKLFAEHSMGLLNSTNVVKPGYVELVDKLVAYSSDLVSPFSHSPMANAIASDAIISFKQAAQVGLGDGFGAGGSMVVEAGDRYDLGDRSGGNDVVVIGAGTTPHDIDGGPGAGNQLYLLGGIWFWQQNGSYYDLYKVGEDGVRNAGTFQRIQTVSLLGASFSTRASTASFADTVASNTEVSPGGNAVLSASAAATAAFNPASLVTHLDGTATTVQQLTPGSTTRVADNISDVAYAGPGVTSLTSSAAHALLAYGPDTTTVTVTGGRAIITSDGSPGGTVAIDTGSTASFVLGGVRAEMIRGHLVGATFEGGSGDSTVAYDGIKSDYTVVAQADGSDLVSSATAGIGNDRLVGINHVAFADHTLDLTYNQVSEPFASFAMTDVTANISSVTIGEDYNGPVSYLQKQLIYTGTDKIAIASSVPNAFLHGSVGDDALNASSGSNVLDGGPGSNFLVGAAGTDGGVDTFFVDGRGTSVTWSTVVNFHHGDAVTFWGFSDGMSTMPWTAVDGAKGYQGATIHSELAGAGTGVNASITFANIDLNDAQSKFTTSTGKVGNETYLQISYTG